MGTGGQALTAHGFYRPLYNTLIVLPSSGRSSLTIRSGTGEAASKGREVKIYVSRHTTSAHPVPFRVRLDRREAYYSFRTKATEGPTNPRLRWFSSLLVD